MDCCSTAPTNDCIVSLAELAKREPKKMRCLHCNEIFKEEEFEGHKCIADPKARRTKDDGVYQSLREA